MNAIEKWHDVMKSGGNDAATKLDELLHNDVKAKNVLCFKVKL